MKKNLSNWKFNPISWK